MTSIEPGGAAAVAEQEQCSFNPAALHALQHDVGYPLGAEPDEAEPSVLRAACQADAEA